MGCHVALIEVELRGEVNVRCLLVVVESDGLDAGQSDALCNLDTEPAKPVDEDTNTRHSYHRPVAQHVPLPTVQRVVDCLFAMRRHLQCV